MGVRLQCGRGCDGLEGTHSAQFRRRGVLQGSGCFPADSERCGGLAGQEGVRL